MSHRRAASAVAVLVMVLTGCTNASTRPEPTPSDAAPTATASSSEASTQPAALSDSEGGSPGQEWRAATTDPAPWAQLTWPSPERLSSIQVYGPSEEALDPTQATAAALYGTLRFSDGSSVEVAGIAAGGAMPTTVAFPARSTTSVRLDLSRQIPGAVIGLRELTAYPEGVTPPRAAPAADSPTYVAEPQGAACAEASGTGSAVTGAARPVLLCPAPGSAVSDAVKILVAVAAGTRVVATVDGSAATASAVGDSTGRAELDLDTTSLPQGPFAVVVRLADAAADVTPLYVQLFRAAGSVAPAGTGDGAPAGMTLQYDEQFDGPLSVTVDGGGAQYAAVKPEPWGGSQFGESVFADPAWGAGTLATLPGGYLRIRNQPIGQFASRQTWGQQHISGILSSQRFGGSGFSAQYGYFEARILGAPGPGAWPAFWMMNSASGVGRASTAKAEVDAVELYGHATRNACHATHAWAAPKGSDGLLSCKDLADSGDWAAQWHTYGVQVRSGGADFFVDGVEVASLDQLSNTEEPFFFMLDLATGGGWPVDLSGTQGTTDMYVDWVRVYT